MGDFNASTGAVIHIDQRAEIKTPTKNQGLLKAEDGKEHSVFPFADTESVSQGVSEFLGEINEPPVLPEEMLADQHVFVEITVEVIEIETEIMQLFQELENTSKNEQLNTTSQPARQAHVKEMPSQGKDASPSQKSAQPETVYSSLFALAHSFNKGLSEARYQKQTESQRNPLPTSTQKDVRPNQALAFSTPQPLEYGTQSSETQYDQQEKEEEQQEGFGGGQQEQQKKEQQKKRDSFSIKASRSVSASQPPTGTQHLGSIENVYIRFMALMARILGQAEAEAHALYMRIKERTDSIDLLTLLVSKINSEKGAIDWSNNEEMKKLIEKVRALGVDIPEGKYSWNEEEKKLLKENIQMRKDSMEKVTQLERTDMQRYLQEASQCHQARSNVLKLLKEVMDTIIHNMRP